LPVTTLTPDGDPKEKAKREAEEARLKAEAEAKAKAEVEAAVDESGEAKGTKKFHQLFRCVFLVFVHIPLTPAMVFLPTHGLLD
jgi:hypothetical protein